MCFKIGVEFYYLDPYIATHIHKKSGSVTLLITHVIFSVDGLDPDPHCIREGKNDPQK